MDDTEASGRQAFREAAGDANSLGMQGWLNDLADSAGPPGVPRLQRGVA
ncbi:MAG TPA: hypothetical protein VLE23_10115 [Geminicoccaceae bacterium]|nr:hypothetical protein [Geminicoccaceae bacterium]